MGTFCFLNYRYSLISHKKISIICTNIGKKLCKEATIHWQIGISLPQYLENYVKIIQRHTNLKVGKNTSTQKKKTVQK